MSKKKKDLLTRVISSIIGFPLVLIIFVWANEIVFNIAISILSIICMYEYCNGFKINKKANPSSWLGYIICLLMVLINLYNLNFVGIAYILIFSILILTIEFLWSKGQKNIIDISVTLLGIIYVPIMLSFLYKIRTIDIYGKILLWFAMIPAWGNDIFAYLIGRKFGKHKLTKVSPNKTVEGSVAGIVSAIIMGIIYTIIINKIFMININYVTIAIIMLVLSVIGQIGDLEESGIKRYCEIKDFSELIPGHGGMLDRFDSVIFIVPFAYILFITFII